MADLMIIGRRGLLGIGAAFVAAPAIVRVSSLMPVSTGWERIPGYRLARWLPYEPVRWLPYEKVVTENIGYPRLDDAITAPIERQLREGLKNVA